MPFDIVKRPNESFVDRLVNLIRSGSQVIEVVTKDETKVLHELELVCDILGNKIRAEDEDEGSWRLLTWSSVSGFQGSLSGQPATKEGDPPTALSLVTMTRQSTDSAPERLDPPEVNGCHCINELDGTVAAIYPWARAEADAEEADKSGRLVVLVQHQELLPRRYVLPLGAFCRARTGQQIKRGYDLACQPRPEALVVLRDFAPFLNNDGYYGLRRLFRERIHAERFNNTSLHRPLILLGTDAVKHTNVSYLVTPVAYRPPTTTQLEESVDFIRESISDPQRRAIAPSFRSSIARDLTGLSQFQVENALAEVVRVHGTFDLDEAGQKALRHTLYLRQQEDWAKEDILELVDPEMLPPADELVGWENYLYWLNFKVLPSMSPRARELKMPRCKGAIAIGPPGSGKSHAGLITARVLGVPLIKVKFARIFGGTVGESERNMDHVIKAIEAKAGDSQIVCLLDELDKSLGGISSSMGGDSGVGQRVLGTLASWMANQNQSALVIATMNTVGDIPPEIMAKGRFNKIFYTGLPGQAERKGILAVCLKRALGGNPAYCFAERFSDDQLHKLGEMANGFAGREINVCVEEACLARLARSGGQDNIPTFEDLEVEFKAGAPQSRSRKDEINKMIDRASKLGEPVGGTVATPAARPTTGRGRRNVDTGSN